MDIGQIPTVPPTEVYASKEDLLLGKTHWEKQPNRQVLPYHDPEHAVIGFSAFLIFDTQDDYDEDMRLLFWYPFGVSLQSTIEYTTGAQRIVQFLDEHKGHLFQCSDPANREWGLVSYRDANQGTSHVLLVRITHMKHIMETPNGYASKIKKVFEKVIGESNARTTNPRDLDLCLTPIL